MKTRLMEKCYTYHIEENDSSLIPEEASDVAVYYNGQGLPRYVHFSTDPEPYIIERGMLFGIKLRKQHKKLRDANKKLNPQRTPEEIKQIVSLLESSLANSQ